VRILSRTASAFGASAVSRSPGSDASCRQVWSGVLSLCGVLLALSTGCGNDEPPAGCGAVSSDVITQLAGDGGLVRASGTSAMVRSGKEAWTCTDSGRGYRSVRIESRRHPTPEKLPTASCVEGWEYAGKPTDYARSCQTRVGGGRRPTLTYYRSGPYVITIAIHRADHSSSHEVKRPASARHHERLPTGP
jgi:hypothetical protein